MAFSGQPPLFASPDDVARSPRPTGGTFAPATLVEERRTRAVNRDGRAAAPRYVVPDPSAVLIFLWQRSGLTVREISAELTEFKVSPSVLSRMFRGDILYAWPVVEQVARILGATSAEIELLWDACSTQRSRRSLSARKGARGSEPDPIECSSAEEFVDKLNDVHIWAGEPSLRQLATASGGRLRRSTISDMLTGSRLPKEMLLIAFLETCGISDVATWKVTWRRLRIKERNERKRAATLDTLSAAPVRYVFDTATLWPALRSEVR